MAQEIYTTYRTILPESSTGRTGSSYCKLDGCRVSTREGKPYCFNHVEHSPYVKALLVEIAVREGEASRLSRGEDVGCNARLVKESLILLRSGSYTSARLARMIDIDPDAAISLIKLLDRNGLARMGKTERGSITVERL